MPSKIKSVKGDNSRVKNDKSFFTSPVAKQILNYLTSTPKSVRKRMISQGNCSTTSTSKSKNKISSTDIQRSPTFSRINSPDRCSPSGRSIKAKKNPQFQPRKVSFRQQLAALLVRNVKIKRRLFFKTLAEFFIPLFFAGNLIFQRPKFKVIPQTFKPVIDTLIYNPNFDYVVSSDWVIINEALDGRKLIKFISLLNGTKLKKYRNPINFHTRFKTRSEFYSYYKEQPITRNFILISLESFENYTFKYSISLDHSTSPINPYDKPDDCTFTSITQVPDTKQMNSFSAGDSCSGFSYYQYGFSTIQALVDSTILKLLYGDQSDLVPDIKLGIFPQPSVLVLSQGNIVWVISSMTSCMTPFMAMIPSVIVGEKENGVKPAMMMMGMKSLPYFISWYIIHISITFFSCFVFSVVVFMLGLTFNIHPMVFYFLIQIYAFSITSFALFLSVFFRTTRTSYVLTGLISILTTGTFYMSELLNLSITVRRVLTVFPPLAYAFTLKYCMFTIADVSMFSFSEFTLGYGIFMLVFDAILYMSLAVALDQLITYREYIWRTFFERKKGLKNLIDVTDTKVVDVETTDGMNLRKAVRIREVTKIYDKTHVAVNNVSMDIFESQITAFLGQNGAGKTTLVNMITGMTPPTSGRITIFGHDVHNLVDLSKLQTRFGICLQENILTDDLTPMEHLVFFATIKGASPKSMKKEIYNLLKETELLEHKDKLSRFLSGGQKRKLCVALALVGRSQIIFLDEPTTGVDPYSRQRIWAILQSYKRNRVIIMTTHMMYEADILCERKAILVRGELRVLGSSLFLKNKYGIGYHLRLDIDPKLADKSKVIDMVLQRIPGSKFEREAKSELLFTLPRNETNRFAGLFRQIDKTIAEKKGILGYGINLTTLEDVFLKITYDHDDYDGKNLKHRSKVEDQNLSINYVDYKTRNWLIFKEFFKIRNKLSKRNWTAYTTVFFQIISMVIFMVLTKSFLKRAGQKVSFNKNLYPNAKIVYSTNASRIDVTNMTEILSKYRPIVHAHQLNLNTLINQQMAIQFLEPPVHVLDEQFQLAILFNKSYTNIMPLLQNIATNMLIQSGVIVHHSFEYPKEKFKIIVKSRPLPDRIMGVMLSRFTGISFVTIFGMILISFPANLAADLVTERSSGIKTFLNINGMRSLEYWLVTGMVHSIIFISLITIATLIIVLFTGATFLRDFECKVAYIIFIIIYVPTALSILYIQTHFFRRKETAQSFIMMASVYASMGIYFVATFGVMYLDVSWLRKACFFIWPLTTTYGFLGALITIDFKRDLMPGFSPFTWGDEIILAYLALLIYFGIAMFLLPLFDHSRSQNETILEIFNLKSPVDSENAEDEYEYMDEDVAKEIFRVKSLTQEWDENPRRKTRDKPLLLINDLTKKYKEKFAVNRFHAIVECGQIFGLLGPNGAGKTTVMKIIAREEAKTSGRIFINGHEVNRSFKRDFFSYCPQINPLWPELTLMEHLRLYTTLRGISPNQREEICNKLVKNFGIEKFKDFKFKKLSGGNQRKLCLLIAVLGNSRMTLLDEPSSGMDPTSKRLMWDLLLKNFEPNGPKSAILTSHAMEEVEALCSRLSIMAQGSMKCIGNIQHLNNKFGKGYILEIKTKRNFQFEKIDNVIKELFPTRRITELALNRIKMTIPQENVKSLADFFETMEELQMKHPEIVEYGLTQSSIEQVFIQFARLHDHEDNPNK